jgi:hypothetical protein
MIADSLIPYLTFINRMAKEGKNVHRRRMVPLHPERSGKNGGHVPEVREAADAANVPLLERSGDAADLL